MIKLVINADDYGFAENQTEAILESFRRGIISSTTVMVTMPDFTRSIVRAKEEGVFDKIGLHLNLTQGYPLTEPIRACAHFCGQDGAFNKVFHNSKWCRFVLSSQEKEAVAIEAEAQMKAYLEAGFPLLHLDSHHHSHTDPSMAKVVLPIARRLGFRSVRLSRNIPRAGFGLAKRWYKKLFNNYAQGLGFTCAHYFGSVTDFEHAASQLPRDAIVELMTHPSFQKDGRFDLSGDLMDMRLPMNSVKEVLARNSGRFNLVPYSVI